MVNNHSLSARTLRWIKYQLSGNALGVRSNASLRMTPRGIARIRDFPYGDDLSFHLSPLPHLISIGKRVGVTMFKIIKIHRLLRLLAAVCAVLTVCAPFAAAYAACWLNVVAAMHRG